MTLLTESEVDIINAHASAGMDALTDLWVEMFGFDKATATTRVAEDPIWRDIYNALNEIDSYTVSED